MDRAPVFTGLISSVILAFCAGSCSLPAFVFNCAVVYDPYMRLYGWPGFGPSAAGAAFG